MSEILFSSELFFISFSLLILIYQIWSHGPFHVCKIIKWLLVVKKNSKNKIYYYYYYFVVLLFITHLLAYDRKDDKNNNNNNNNVCCMILSKIIKMFKEKKINNR